MCALAGYDIVALTDHNTVGNCAAFCQGGRGIRPAGPAGDGAGPVWKRYTWCACSPIWSTPLPFGDLVRRRLPPMDNDPRFFGPQLLMDSRDRLLGEETAMLAGATDIGVYEAAALVREYGGLAYPAHIDRDSFSVLANLGLWDPEMGFSLAELSPALPPGATPPPRPGRTAVRHRLRRPLSGPDPRRGTGHGPAGAQPPGRSALVIALNNFMEYMHVLHGRPVVLWRGAPMFSLDLPGGLVLKFE